MQLNVTEYVESHDCGDYSGSIAELGENAGRITWNNSMAAVADKPLVTRKRDIAKCKDWFGDFGAWEDDEIAAWSDEEVNALLLQFVAGDIREMEDHFDDYADYLKASEEGRCGGRLYKGDDDEWYFYVGC